MGAGIAGLTLAGRLCQQGRPPVIVERSVPAAAGYAIGLYPLGSCVLHGFGTYERLREVSLVLERYELASESGEVLRSFDMSVLTDDIGPVFMVSRAELVRVLELSCASADLRRGVSISSLEQHRDGVDVTFDDGSNDRFDIVIGCDGMGSQTRDLVFGLATGYDSGWLLWTWWVSKARFAPEVAREWWGAGNMLGAYPAPGRVMCAAGGPEETMRGEDVRSLLHRHFAKLIDRVPEVGAAIGEFDAGHPWPMSDIRARHWVHGRVALCGDAAVGFMPTAGVGASNAMRAAAALADELSRADAASIPLALELYEKRCRARVEANQTNSRRLARVMFVRPAFLAKTRDELTRRFPPKWALSEIVGSVHRPF